MNLVNKICGGRDTERRSLHTVLEKYQNQPRHKLVQNKEEVYPHHRIVDLFYLIQLVHPTIQFLIVFTRYKVRFLLSDNLKTIWFQVSAVHGIDFLEENERQSLICVLVEAKVRVGGESK